MVLSQVIKYSFKTYFLTTTWYSFMCMYQSLDQLGYFHHPEAWRTEISGIHFLINEIWYYYPFRLHRSYLFEKIIQILKINLKTNKNIPTILSKKAPRRCQSFLSFRKVIMWDNKTSLAFWRPKNTHNRVIPFSIKVCFTIFSGSLSKVTTFCWTISCKAWSSKNRKKKNVINFLSSKHTDPVFLTPWRKQNDYRSHHRKPTITKFFHYSKLWRTAGKMKHRLKNIIMVTISLFTSSIYEAQRKKLWGSTRERYCPIRST